MGKEATRQALAPAVSAARLFTRYIARYAFNFIIFFHGEHFKKIEFDWLNVLKSEEDIMFVSIHLK